MRKQTIFNYELRRLLLSKEYLLLLFATLVYCTILLRSMVIYGANYTAPFSPLTFLTYCASLAPFLFVLLLLLLARQSKASEIGAEAVISATPMPLPVFKLLRYGAVLCAFFIAAALPLIACFAFYRLVFSYTAVGTLLLSGLALLLPSSFLLIGAAVLIGNAKQTPIYVLLAAVLIVGVFQIQLPGVLDLFGDSAVKALTSGSADISKSSVFIFERLAFIIIGLALIIASLLRSRKRVR